MIGTLAGLALIPVLLWLALELDARKWHRRELGRRRRRQTWRRYIDELDEREREGSFAARPPEIPRRRRP